jgi:hypothetical protein
MTEDEGILFTEEPEPTPEEVALELIRSQEDCLEEKYYYGEEFFFLLNYINISSVIVNKMVKQTFLYDEIGGGKGSTLEIIY